MVYKRYVLCLVKTFWNYMQIEDRHFPMRLERHILRRRWKSLKEFAGYLVLMARPDVGGGSLRMP
jgi:hypothetical protein